MNCSNNAMPAEAQAQAQAGIREQDRFMPIANVIRIMRRVLPAHAKISDDAKETIQECVSEYISFITGEANDRCQREQRKTITAEDVLWAMSKLGFDDYIEPLSVYLSRYREFEGDQRGSIRGEPLPLVKHRHQMATTPMMAHVMHQHAHPSAMQVPHQYVFFGENGIPDGYYSGPGMHEEGDGGASGPSTPHTLPLMSNLDNHHDLIK
jgi:nuclear transcription Y subunit beta